MGLETVKIRDDNRRGWKIINKSEFDAKKHELFSETKAAHAPKKKGKK